MDHKYKSFELKAKEDETGIIAGFFSTYDETPDSYGDIIKPGAFTETIKKREESGHPFPLCFNHDFSQVIGVVDKIEDTEKGPYIEAHFLDTELAQDVRKMLKSGAIYQFSFAYDVLGWENPSEEQRKAGVWNILTKLDVFEISVVTVPANQNAVVTEVKSVEPETKAGKRNSKKDADVINQIIDLAKSLLDEPEDKPTEDEEKSEEAQPEVNPAGEEPKSEGNSKRAEALLEKINSLKGGS
jgi:HK97 family phage prohead protease